MGNIQYTFTDKYEEYMQNFLCRLLRHDFVVSYINDFFNQNERTYYSFFMLMKVLGAHKNLKFQTNYWSDCYIYFYEKLGIHGILFIPLLLSKGSTLEKKKVIKKYLNEHINNTKERLLYNSNLVINLLEFKKVILTYISCVSTRGLENVIKAMDNDPEEKKFLQQPNIKEEIKNYRLLYSNQLVESFVDVLLRPYSRQNYYVNAGKFIDDNIDFLTDDKNIRLRLKEFSEKQKKISDLFKTTNLLLRKNERLDIDKLEQLEKKNDDKSISFKSEPEFIHDTINNNIINTNINNNKNNNNIIIDISKGSNEGSKSKDNERHKKSPLIGSSNSNLNIINEKELINNKGKENNNINLINTNTNFANRPFKNDWDVKNENSIKPLDLRGDNNIHIINTNINNKGNKNDSISDFEESSKEENIPKNI